MGVVEMPPWAHTFPQTAPVSSGYQFFLPSLPSTFTLADDLDTDVISMLQFIWLFSLMCEPFMLLWHRSVQVMSSLSATKARNRLDGLVLFRLLIYHILVAFMYFSVS